MRRRRTKTMSSEEKPSVDERPIKWAIQLTAHLNPDNTIYIETDVEGDMGPLDLLFALLSLSGSLEDTLKDMGIPHTHGEIIRHE